MTQYTKSISYRISVTKSMLKHILLRGYVSFEDVDSWLNEWKNDERFLWEIEKNKKGDSFGEDRKV